MKVLPPNTLNKESITICSVSLSSGEDVFLRGFGSFIVKQRAQKTGRDISKNTTIIIPAHNVPAFKPSKEFVNKVKTNVQL